MKKRRKEATGMISSLPANICTIDKIFTPAFEDTVKPTDNPTFPCADADSNNASTPVQESMRNIVINESKLPKSEQAFILSVASTQKIIRIES